MKIVDNRALVAKKKQYIQPSVEVNAMNAVQNLMSASNPWNQNGIIKDTEGEEIVPQF